MTVHRTYQAVIQMDHTIRALREFITSDVRADETYLPKPLAGILDQVIAQMSEFAKSRSVEIVKKDACPNVQVLTRERELARAFSNVLHNAIKYSWSRSHQRSPWVTVEINCTGDRVEVKFENWGVPIARDEIDTGLIYHLGYRGRLSKDRNRLGTGIGLTDALRVAKQHSGELTVQSRPASSTQTDESSRDYYDHPFLTTVIFSIPMFRSR
jgi:signal transduction histidine kinase